MTAARRDAGDFLVRFRLAPGVKWRCWRDGIVIFAPASAQTALLSLETAPLIESLAQPAGMRCEASERIRLPVLDHLVRMAAVDTRP